MAHAFNPITQRAKAGRSLEFQDSQSYIEKPSQNKMNKTTKKKEEKYSLNMTDYYFCAP